MGKIAKGVNKMHFTILYGNYCYIFIENSHQKFSPCRAFHVPLALNSRGKLRTPKNTIQGKALICVYAMNYIHSTATPAHTTAEAYFSHSTRLGDAAKCGVIEAG